MTEPLMFLDPRVETVEAVLWCEGENNALKHVYVGSYDVIMPKDDDNFVSHTFACTGCYTLRRWGISIPLGENLLDKEEEMG